MTLPLYIGTIPDGTALEVLDRINNSFLALFSQCLSPTPPEDPIGGLPWINSTTQIKYIRDPQGVAWVAIGKFDGTTWIPFGGSGGGGGGDDEESVLLGPYATLAAGDGFAAGKNGGVSVRHIVAGDLPTLSASQAGIPPAPTAAQAQHVLRPSGWSPLFRDLGAKEITGQSSIVWTGFPPLTYARCVWDITMPPTQVATVQIGSGGAPKTTGYETAIAAPPSEDLFTGSTSSFPLWRDFWESSSIHIMGSFEIMALSNNRYFFRNTALGDGSKFVHTTVGWVILSGVMDYIRVITSGATPVAMTSGFARIIGG